MNARFANLNWIGTLDLSCKVISGSTKAKHGKRIPHNDWICKYLHYERKGYLKGLDEPQVLKINLNQRMN